jgi:hypothetical protein
MASKSKKQQMVVVSEAYLDALEEVSFASSELMADGLSVANLRELEKAHAKRVKADSHTERLETRLEEYDQECTDKAAKKAGAKAAKKKS